MSIVYPDNWKVTVGPTTEPVTLAEAKAQLRLTSYETSEDTYIEGLIPVCRAWCEAFANRAYCTQTVVARYTGFGHKMVLPLNPVISITSITYIDSNGDTHTVDASNYNLDNYSDPAFIYPDYNYTWPTPRQDYNCVTVTYQAGYDADPSDTDDVPYPVKQAIKMLVGHYYNNREQVVQGALTEVPLGVYSLLHNRTYL
jgi:uncharacterized phiE125 gp8 family phage protein